MGWFGGATVMGRGVWGNRFSTVAGICLGVDCRVFAARVGGILLGSGLLECKLSLRRRRVAYLLQVFTKRPYRLSS